MTTDTATATCPVLTGNENFDLWHARIFAKLRREKCSDVVQIHPSRIRRPPTTSTSSPNPPAKTSHSSSAAQTDEDSDPKAGAAAAASAALTSGSAEAKYTESRDVRDRKALGIIQEHVDDRLLLQIDWCQTAQEAYDQLIEIHQSTNVGINAFFTLLTILTAKWDGDGATVKDHIAKITAADAKLASMGKPLDKELLAFFLLFSLPSDEGWENFTTSILGAIPDGSAIKFSEIANRVVSTALRRDMTTSESALKAKATTGTPSSTKKWCVLHDSDTHNTEDCATLKKQKERRKDKRKKRKDKEKANKAAQKGAGESGSSSEDEEGALAALLHRRNPVVSRETMNTIRAYVVSSAGKRNKDPIALDSAASSHMTPNRHWFDEKSFKVLNPPKLVHFGDDSYAQATGIGSIFVRSKVKGKPTSIELTRVLYIPTFEITLVSVPKLDKHGLYSVFKNGGCQVKQTVGDRTVMEGTLSSGLYILNTKPVIEGIAETALATIDINVLHRNMGHVGFDRLARMVKDGRIENVKEVTGTPKFCAACAHAKMKKLPFRHKGMRCDTPLRVVHSDVGGPINPPDRHGHRYWVTFIDDHSRFVWVYLLKKKSEVPAVFKQWKKDVEAFFEVEVGEFRLSQRFPKFFQTDGGGEYTSNQFERELREAGIIHLTTAADTPEQNGLAEKMNQTLANLTVAMLIDSGLPKSFWSDALLTSAFVTVRSTSKGLKGKSPYEVLFAKKPDISWLRPFGSTAYALIPKDQRPSKFSSKARPAIHLGYTVGKKAYKLMDSKTRQIFHSRHVIFDDSDSLPLTSFPSPSEDQTSWTDLLRYQETGGGREKESPNPKQIRTSTQDEDDEEQPGDRDTVGDDQDAVGAVGDDRNAVGAREVLEEHPETFHTPPQSPQRPSPKPTAPSVPKKRNRIDYRSQVNPESIAQRRPRRTTTQATNRNTDVDIPESKRRKVNSVESERQEERMETFRVIQPRAEDPQISGDDESIEEQEVEGNEDEEDEEEALKALFSKIFSGDHDNEDNIAFAGMNQTGPSDIPLPKSIVEALSGPNARFWRAALKDELQSFIDNDVFTVTKIPDGVKLVTSKAVFRVKLDGNGKLQKFKIRIVARGFTQRPGVDFKEVFAPVASLESVRLIIALAAKYDLELDQMDVSTAYLNGELEEDIYLMPPDGVDIPEGYCWKLNRSLYGLKQAGRTWNLTLDRKLKDHDFIRLDAETCLYVTKNDKGDFCFLVVYVDDFLLAASSRRFMNEVKKRLMSTFKMKDLGPASYVLGIQITRDRKNKTISLNQSQYIDTILKRCGMQDCGTANTPMAANKTLTADDPKNPDAPTMFETEINGVVVSYASVVGSLMYAAMGTRPDIAYTVGVLGRFASKPKPHHWEAAKRSLRFLKATRHLCLVFGGRDSNRTKYFMFAGYSDSDWSGDPDTSRSTSGYVYMAAAAAIGWMSKRQTMVALSSAESEYIGLCTAGQHLAWLRKFFEDIGYRQLEPTTLC